MITAPWKEGLTLVLDSGAVEDYRWDFAGWLDGESIATATVIGVGCTAAVTGSTSSEVTTRVSAATNPASIEVTVTSTTGRKTSRSLAINVHDL